MGEPRIEIKTEDVTERADAERAADAKLQSFETFMRTEGKMEPLVSSERALLKTFLVYGAEGMF